jgi:proteasome lid subunit RPN8/RPN11
MIIRGRVVAEIRSALEAAYPREGCGFLVGRVDGDVRVRGQIQAGNRRAEDRAGSTRYLIAPEEFQAVTRRVARDALEIVGVYHSHPDVPPDPSAYDRDHAWPWYQYLIVSVQNGIAGDMRAWQLTDDRRAFVEQTVQIVD